MDDRLQDVLNVAFAAGYLLDIDQAQKVVDELGEDYTDTQVIAEVEALGIEPLAAAA